MRRHAKQRAIPPMPSTMRAGPTKLFAVFSRMRSPVAARMMELTERKKVLTCCRRETRASEVPTKSLYCSSSIGASASFNVPDLCSPKSSCSTVFGSDAIQLPHYSLHIPRQGLHVQVRKSRRNFWRRRLNGNRHDSLPEFRALSDLPIDSFAPIRCFADQTYRDTTGSDKASRVCFPSGLKCFLDGVVMKHQG